MPGSFIRSSLDAVFRSIRFADAAAAGFAAPLPFVCANDAAGIAESDRHATSTIHASPRCLFITSSSARSYVRPRHFRFSYAVDWTLGPTILIAHCSKHREARMTRIVFVAVGALALTTAAFAQTNDESIERALSAAPRQMKENATVIKWKADNTYETLKKGTNRLVCYDRSGEPGRQPFAVQCTSLANLDRVAQNRKFEAITDRTARQAAIEAAEKDGTRVKPEF